MRSLEKLIKNYIKRYPSETLPFDILKFLKHKNCFSKSNHKGHFTGSAWIVSPNKEYVLMTHHKKLRMWLQLGGHAEGERNLFKVALREAEEESGIQSFISLDEEIFDMDIHQISQDRDSIAHTHYDVRFLLEADPVSSKIKVSEESYDVAWIPIHKVLSLNAESSIKRMLKKTLQLKKSKINNIISREHKSF